MKPTRTWRRSAALLLLLSSALSACATKSTPLPPVVVQGPKLPPLPPQAKEPAVPAICWPSCTDGLMRERESWRQLLMSAESGAKPASAPTK